MNILLALVLYNTSISSYNQIEPLYQDAELFQMEGAASSSDGEEPAEESKRLKHRGKDERRSTKGRDQASSGPQSSFRLHDLQDDLTYFIQHMHLDLVESQKASPSSVYPSKLPVSSVLLSFLFLIQSPLPLALSEKRAQQAREQAEQLRHQQRPGTTRSNAERSARRESAQPQFDSAATKQDIQELLRLQVAAVRDIFNNDGEESLGKHYLLNSVLFYCLLFVNSDAIDGESLPSEISYLAKKQSVSELTELVEVLGALVDVSGSLLTDARQQQALDVVKAVLFSAWTKLVRVPLEKYGSDQLQSELKFEGLLPVFRQREIVDFCQHNTLGTNAVHDWLIHKNRQSFQTVLHFQHAVTQPGKQTKIGSNAPQLTVNDIQLDLQYVLGMQNLGYDVLKYYKLAENNQRKAGMSTKDQMVHGVSEIKMLVNSVYQFYTAQEDIHELLRAPNPFYECFLDQIIPSFSQDEQQRFLKLLQENRFKQAYEKLTMACFNLRYQDAADSNQPKQVRILIDTQVKKFVQYGIHSKYFLLTLSMALNLRSYGDPALTSQIERSRLICLASLPLMFDNEEFREQVEESIAGVPDLAQLIQSDNNDFFRLIKAMVKDEDTFHLQNQFEKYFALSGFARNLLNEVIKLQASNDSTIFASNVMLIKVLDTLTYFMTQKNGSGLQLRRAPRSLEDQSSFLFDNLVDYKSFEFLSKLFKITEKLIEYDQDMVVMNLWYKLVENQRANYEILGKFLIHNLSSHMLKLKSQASSTKVDVQDAQTYGIEFEKTKRYSINIFNYIKARVQRADIRNSLQVAQESPTWAKKMTEVLMHAQLNVQSKYVLEKVKLKKVLQTMHREINQSDTALKLKGGIDTEVLVLQFAAPSLAEAGAGGLANVAKQSIRMSQLLQSQTFLRAFSSAQTRREQTVVATLLFHFQRIMKEKFVKVASANQLAQFNDLVIRYLENALVFIANDTDRQLQLIQFSKEQELTIVVVILILTGHLMLHHSDIRFKYLLDLFKTLQANISGLAPFFFLNTLSPRQLQVSSSKGHPKERSRPSKFAEQMLTMFNYKTTLFDCFEQFTRIFFALTSNLASDSDLRINLMELYQHIFRGLREVQKQKLNAQKEEEAQDVSGGRSISSLSVTQSISLIQSGKNLRVTLLAMMQSAFFSLHELASVSNKIMRQSMSSPNLHSQSSGQLEHQQFVNLCKNFRQHMTSMIDYTLDTYQLDRLRVNQAAAQQKKTQSSVITNTNDIMARDMSTATRQILFASNALFWLGVACLETAFVSNDSQDKQLYESQIQQIQYLGMAAVRRTLEETSFVKILIVFEKLSDAFYSYNLQMESHKQSLISILFNAIRNPLCTRDALKTLILSIRIQDSRLLVGKYEADLDVQDSQNQVDNLADDPHRQEQRLKEAVGKVELVRLLFLLPYFMQQFLAPQADQLFQNKKNMIQLLKKSLPSIGINKKSAIFERLEVIQRSTANQQVEQSAEENAALSEEFMGLIKETIELIYQQNFRGSLIDCLTTFRELYKIQTDKKKGSESQHYPISAEILAPILACFEVVLAQDDQAKLCVQVTAKKAERCMFNRFSEILGEEADNYRPELRPLYFGLKNVILKELQAQDKEIEVAAFFDMESMVSNTERDTMASRSSMTKKKSSNITRKSFKREGYNNHQFNRQVTQKTKPTASIHVLDSGSKQISEPLRKEQIGNEEQNQKIINDEPLIDASPEEDETNQDEAQIDLISLNEQIMCQELQQTEVTDNFDGAYTFDELRDDQVLEDNDDLREGEHEEQQQQPEVMSARQIDNRQTIEKLESSESQEKKYCHSPTGGKLPSRYQTLTATESERQTRRRQETGAMTAQSKSKSRNRYERDQPSSDDGDQAVQIEDVPQVSRAQPLLKRGGESEIQSKKKTFAEMTQEQHEIMQSHQSSKLYQDVKQPSSEVPQPEHLNETENRDMMTFQKRYPTRPTNFKTMPREPELPVSNFEQQLQMTEQESISSKDHRRFYQAPIDPMDNQSQISQRTAAQEIAARNKMQFVEHLRPQTSTVQKHHQEFLYTQAEVERLLQQQKFQNIEQNRPQTQAAPVKKIEQQAQIKKGPKLPKRSDMPSALQPGFVAEKSNQIWSDVVSQKSGIQKKKDVSKEEYLQQNQKLIQQMQGRDLFEDRQSEKSFKSFTMISQQQKYSKNEPNFDFSSEEIKKK